MKLFVSALLSIISMSAAAQITLLHRTPRFDSFMLRARLSITSISPDSLSGANAYYEDGKLVLAFRFHQEVGGIHDRTEDSTAAAAYRRFLDVYLDKNIVDVVKVHLCDSLGVIYGSLMWYPSHDLDTLPFNLKERCEIFVGAHVFGSEAHIGKRSIKFDIQVPDGLAGQFLNLTYSKIFAIVAYEFIFQNVLDRYRAFTIRFIDSNGCLLKTVRYKLWDIPGNLKLPAPKSKPGENKGFFFDS